MPNLINPFMFSSPPTTSYANPLGSGDRTGLVAVFYSGSVGSGSPGDVVNGSFANTFRMAGTGANHRYVFDFGTPHVVDEATWYQSLTDPHGTWKFQGSNDGDGTGSGTYVDIGGSFILGGALTNVLTSLAGNTTPYRFLRLQKLSGIIDGNPRIQEVEFKISA